MKNILALLSTSFNLISLPLKTIISMYWQKDEIAYWEIKNNNKNKQYFCWMMDKTQNGG